MKINLISNKDAVNLINRWQSKNEFPQAIIINGAAKSGKLTLAKYIAQAALCSAEQKPCGSCANCKKVYDGSHPDLTIVSKENDGLKADSIRSLRANAVIRPNEADRRVIIIKNAQDMNNTAQNALLKIIEEPPQFLMFIFTCIEDKKLLDTINSRCVQLNTSPVSPNDAIPYLISRVRELSEFSARQAIEQSAGNIGRALSLLTEKPTAAQELAERMGRAIILKDELALMKICGRFEKDKSLYEQTLEMLLKICRDALISKNKSDITISGMKNLTDDMAAKVSTKQLCNVIENINRLLSYSRGYMNNTLLISITSALIIG